MIMRKLFTFAFLLSLLLPAKAYSQVWWGYFNESDFSIKDGTIGIGQPNPFLTGIAIPANHDEIRR